MKKKILLIGGEGVLGTEILQKFGDENNYISLDIKERKINRRKSDFVSLDICDYNQCMSIIPKLNPDGVVHLAAVSRVVEAELNKEKCIQTNIEGTKNIINAIKSCSKTPWIIFASSREVYGEKGRNVSEDCDKEPINIYGHSKLISENLWISYSKIYNSQLLIMRLSNIYGSIHDIPGRVVPSFMKSILNNQIVNIEGGGQLIDFTFIDDFLLVFRKLEEIVNTKRIKSMCFHIAPGNASSLYKLIETIEHIVGKKSKINILEARSYDVEKFEADNSLIKEIVPEISFHFLEHGIKKYYDKLCTHFSSIEKGIQKCINFKA